MSLEEVEGGKPAGEGNPEPETSNEAEQEETNAESTVVEDSAPEAAPDSEPPEIDDGEKDE